MAELVRIVTAETGLSFERQTSTLDAVCAT